MPKESSGIAPKRLCNTRCFLVYFRALEQLGNKRDSLKSILNHQDCPPKPSCSSLLDPPRWGVVKQRPATHPQLHGRMEDVLFDPGGRPTHCSRVHTQRNKEWRPGCDRGEGAGASSPPLSSPPFGDGNVCWSHMTRDHALVVCVVMCHLHMTSWSRNIPPQPPQGRTTTPIPQSSWLWAPNSSKNWAVDNSKVIWDDQTRKENVALEIVDPHKPHALEVESIDCANSELHPGISANPGRRASHRIDHSPKKLPKAKPPTSQPAGDKGVHVWSGAGGRRRGRGSRAEVLAAAHLRGVVIGMCGQIEAICMAGRGGIRQAELGAWCPRSYFQEIFHLPFFWKTGVLC